jgi:transcriptional regulator with XRE-family HTH domain
MSQKRYRTHLIKLLLAKSNDEGRQISYQEVANLTELSYPTVHRYATKEIQRPDYETVATLAGYFGVAIEQFIYEAEVDQDEQNPEGQLMAVAAN